MALKDIKFPILLMLDARAVTLNKKEFCGRKNKLALFLHSGKFIIHLLPKTLVKYLLVSLKKSHSKPIMINKN